MALLIRYKNSLLSCRACGGAGIFWDQALRMSCAMENSHITPA